MQYRPRWKRIIIAAVVLHIIILFGFLMIWSNKTSELEEEIQEIEWVDVDVEDKAAKIEESAKNKTQPSKSVLEFEFPPIEIPDISEPVYVEPELPKQPLPPVVEYQPIPEIKPDIRETMDDKASKQIEDDLGKEKVEDDSTKKIKVLSKVYPRDVVNEFMEAGIIKEKVELSMGKTVVAVTIETDGRVKNAKIMLGGSNDENGNTINVLIEAAASRWVFEPFIDNDGITKEMKTQIEFKPEDFH